MSDDVLDRAQELLDEVVDDPRLIHLHSSGYVVATINELADELRAARTENEQLRGELAATKGLLESTQQSHSATIRDFCTLRDALPREQVEQLLGGPTNDR